MPITTTANKMKNNNIDYNKEDDDEILSTSNFVPIKKK